MSLKEQLQADLKTAMLSKQELRRDVIRFTQAALKNAELAKQQKLVKERSHLWQTGEVDAEGNRTINEAELEKQRAEIDKLTPLTDEEQLAVLITEVARKNPHILVVLDSCHSGSATRAAEGTEVRLTDQDPRQRPLESFLPEVVPAVQSWSADPQARWTAQWRPRHPCGYHQRR